MANKYSLLKNYEWWGTFWLEGQTNTVFSGKLIYSPISGIKLEFITTDNSIMEKFKNYTDIYHILGYINEKNSIQKVSLFKCFFPHINLWQPYIKRIQILAISLIVGKQHFHNSNEEYLSFEVKYKYMSEFIKDNNHNDIENIISFKLHNQTNVDIYPKLLKDLYDVLIALNKSKNESHNDLQYRRQKLQNLKNYLNEELSKINAFIKKDNITDNYICKIYKNNNQLQQIDTFINDLNFIKIAFSILTNKIFYIEEIYCLFNKTIINTQNHSDYTTYVDSCFVFHNINHISSTEQLDNIRPPDFYDSEVKNPFNLQYIKSDQITSYMKEITENNLLAEYLYNIIKNDVNNLSKDQMNLNFILAFTLLDSEINNLDKSSENYSYNKRYDFIFAKYTDDSITDILFASLTNPNANNDKFTLKEIFKNNDNYGIGSITSYLRNSIVHKNPSDNSLEKFAGNSNDREIKLSIIKKYKQYWGDNNNIVINMTIKILSILLFKIMYSKINLEKDILKQVIDRLLFKYYGPEKNRINRINKIIADNLQVNKKLNS